MHLFYHLLFATVLELIIFCPFPEKNQIYDVMNKKNFVITSKFIGVVLLLQL